MAQVRFFPMQVRFQKLRELLDQYDATNFSTLVFQPQNPDAQQSRDEYDLTAFVVRSDGSVQDHIVGEENISRLPDVQPYRSNANKIALGNYPLSRELIVLYRDGQGGHLIEYLTFIPEEYSRDNRYVSYIIRRKNVQGNPVANFTEDQLNPSPPADPQ